MCYCHSAMRTMTNHTLYLEGLITVHMQINHSQLEKILFTDLSEIQSVEKNSNKKKENQRNHQQKQLSK